MGPSVAPDRPSASAYPAEVRYLRGGVDLAPLPRLCLRPGGWWK